MLRSKYNNFKFYCHKMRGYDIIFIPRTLCDYNDTHTDQYELNPMFRDSIII